MLNEAATAWLTERSLDIEIADKYGLASSNRGDGDWIEIPYLREGKRVNGKYRRIDEKGHSQDANAVKCVWNEDALRDKTLTGPIIITEGEFDALAAIQAGYLRTVSVPDGAPAEALGDADTAKYSYVDDLIPLLRGENELIIAADGDPAGANLLSDLAVRLGKARCKFLKYPVKCKDLGDALREYGEKGVTKTIERAAFIEMPGLRLMSEMPPAPPLTVYRAGIATNFDERVGICKRHVSVWTGIPNQGKTTMVNAVMFSLAERYNWRIALCSFEAEPNLTGPFHRDLARYLARKPIADLVDEDLDRALEFSERHFVYFETDQTGEDITLNWMLEHAEAAVTRYGADMITIDPWSMLDHEQGKLTENEYTSVCLKAFKKFSKRFNVHTAIVAHPKKMDIVRGSYRVPSGYDISGSAHWFNHPELGVTVHRDVDKGGNVALVRVWKSKRHDEMGATGDLWLRLFPSGRFEEWFDEEKDAV